MSRLVNKCGERQQKGSGGNTRAAHSSKPTGFSTNKASWLSGGFEMTGNSLASLPSRRWVSPSHSFAKTALTSEALRKGGHASSRKGSRSEAPTLRAQSPRAGSSAFLRKSRLAEAEGLGLLGPSRLVQLPADFHLATQPTLAGEESPS